MTLRKSAVSAEPSLDRLAVYKFHIALCSATVPSFPEFLRR